MRIRIHFSLRQNRGQHLNQIFLRLGFYTLCFSGNNFLSMNSSEKHTKIESTMMTFPQVSRQKSGAGSQFIYFPVSTISFSLSPHQKLLSDDSSETQYSFPLHVVLAFTSNVNFFVALPMRV